MSFLRVLDLFITYRRGKVFVSFKAWCKGYLPFYFSGTHHFGGIWDLNPGFSVREEHELSRGVANVKRDFWTSTYGDLSPSLWWFPHINGIAILLISRDTHSTAIFADPWSEQNGSA